MLKLTNTAVMAAIPSGIDFLTLSMELTHFKITDQNTSNRNIISTSSFEFELSRAMEVSVFEGALVAYILMMVEVPLVINFPQSFRMLVYTRLKEHLAIPVWYTVDGWTLIPAIWNLYVLNHIGIETLIEVIRLDWNHQFFAWYSDKQVFKSKSNWLEVVVVDIATSIGGLLSINLTRTVACPRWWCNHYFCHILSDSISLFY